MSEVIKPENRNMTASIISDVTGNVYWVDPESKVIVCSMSSLITEPPEYYALICSRIKVLDDLFSSIVEDNRNIEEPKEGWNYVVHCSRGGKYKDWGCMTIEEAWALLGKRTIWSTYDVRSPKKLDVSEFIPY